MKIENKEMLLYSAQKAVSAVCRIGGENVDEKEAYFVVGTAIHWVIDCIERIPREYIKDEHKSIFSALKCANNCLKHNATFKDAHQAEGLDFPYDYAYDYGSITCGHRLMMSVFPWVWKIRERITNYS